MKKQPWQDDGIGTDIEALKRVLNAFLSDGIQDTSSRMALKDYIVTKLDDNAERQMYEIDADVMLEMYVECLGARTAFISINRVLGGISPEAYEEVTAKYEERCKKLEEQKDKVLSDYQRAAWVAEDAEKRIAELEDTLKHYKADLYDFYAQAGKLPNYDHERRQ